MITSADVSNLNLKSIPTLVTIGKFDGIHLGHQQLLTRTLELANEFEFLPGVVTFDAHPQSVIQPGTEPPALIGPNQKKELIEKAGMSFTLNLVIEESLIRLNPRDFVRDVIVGQLGAKIVVVGEGFRFGFEQSGDVSTLLDLGLELGFTVQVVPYLKHGGEIVSTSRVRSLLAAGDVREASKLLGRFHSSLGVIEHGLKIGREIGFPTANMSRSAEGLLPLDGVYAGWLISEGHKYMAALSVGTNETFEAVPRILEAHVIDRKDLDLYDKVVQMEFVEFIRGAVKFDGVEDLVIEINRDLEKIRVVLS